MKFHMIIDQEQRYLSAAKFRVRRLNTRLEIQVLLW